MASQFKYRKYVFTKQITFGTLLEKIVLSKKAI